MERNPYAIFTLNQCNKFLRNTYPQERLEVLRRKFAEEDIDSRDIDDDCKAEIESDCHKLTAGDDGSPCVGISKCVDNMGR